jgi:hypothetical protein
LAKDFSESDSKDGLSKAAAKLLDTLMARLSRHRQAAEQFVEATQREQEQTKS